MNKIEQSIRRVVNQNVDSKELIQSYREYLASINEAQSTLLSMVFELNEKDTALSRYSSLDNENDWDYHGHENGRGDFIIRKNKGEVEISLINIPYEAVSHFEYDDRVAFYSESLALAKRLDKTREMGTKVLDLSNNPGILPNGEIFINEAMLLAQAINMEFDIQSKILNLSGTHEYDLEIVLKEAIESFQMNVIVDSALESLNEGMNDVVLNISDLSASVSHRIGDLTDGANIFLNDVADVLRTPGGSILDKLYSLTSRVTKNSVTDDDGVDLLSISSDYDQNGDFSGCSPVSGWISSINIDLTKPIQTGISLIKLQLAIPVILTKGLVKGIVKGFKWLKNKTVETFVDPTDFIVNKGRGLESLLQYPAYSGEIILPTDDDDYEYIVDKFFKQGQTTDILTPFGRVSFGNASDGKMQYVVWLTPTTPLVGVQRSQLSVNNIFVPAVNRENINDIDSFSKPIDMVEYLFPEDVDAYIIDEDNKDDGYWFSTIYASRMRMATYLGLLVARYQIFSSAINVTDYNDLSNAYMDGTHLLVGEEVLPHIINSPAGHATGNENKLIIPAFGELTYQGSGSGKFETLIYSFDDDKELFEFVNKGTKTTNRDFIDLLRPNIYRGNYIDWFSWELLESLRLQKSEGMMDLMNKTIEPMFIPYIDRGHQLRFKYDIATDGKHKNRINNIVIAIVITAVVIYAGIKFVKIRRKVVRANLARKIEIDNLKRSLTWSKPGSNTFNSKIETLRVLEKRDRKLTKLGSLIGVPGIKTVSDVSSSINFDSPFKVDNSEILDILK